MKKFSKKRSPKHLSKERQVKIARQIPRPWGLATRLEHRRVRGKKSSKPR